MFVLWGYKLINNCAPTAKVFAITILLQHIIARGGTIQIYIYIYTNYYSNHDIIYITKYRKDASNSNAQGTHSTVHNISICTGQL